MNFHFGKNLRLAKLNFHFGHNTELTYQHLEGFDWLVNALQASCHCPFRFTKDGLKLFTFCLSCFEHPGLSTHPLETTADRQKQNLKAQFEAIGCCALKPVNLDINRDYFVVRNSIGSFTDCFNLLS